MESSRAGVSGSNSSSTSSNSTYLLYGYELGDINADENSETLGYSILLHTPGCDDYSGAPAAFVTLNGAFGGSIWNPRSAHQDQLNVAVMDYVLDKDRDNNTNTTTNTNTILLSAHSPLFVAIHSVVCYPPKRNPTTGAGATTGTGQEEVITTTGTGAGTIAAGQEEVITTGQE
jgi:hypothetical protein